jgi:hypothetical protein
MRGRRVRDATSKERHVCARRRDGEPAGSQKPEVSLLHPPTPSARRAPFRGNTLRAHGATNKSHHVCARRRDVRRPRPFPAENDADVGRSFAAVEWHYSDGLQVNRRGGHHAHCWIAAASHVL